MWPEDAATLDEIYRALLACYGEPRWWPAKTPYEVIVGAVLTQNTAWDNVEKAIARFGGDVSPERVAGIMSGTLAEIIRPAGSFNQKTAYLKAVTAWFGLYGYSVRDVQKLPLARARAELLAVKGIGPETADSILLYAFGFASFVVDAYTVRLASRLPIDTGTGVRKRQGVFRAPAAQRRRNLQQFSRPDRDQRERPLPQKTRLRRVPAVRYVP